MRSQVARKNLSATERRNLQTLLLVSVFEPDVIGERIAAARREAGLTQEELADAIGVSTRSLQGFELGERIPYRYMEKIATVTRREWEWLLHGATSSPVAEPGAVVARLDEILERLDSLEQRLLPADQGAQQPDRVSEGRGSR